MKCFLVLLLLATSALAQQSPRHELGFSPEKVYHFGDLDAINSFNGNLMIRIPIGPTYPVSSDLQYGLLLTYNSNVWEFTTVNGFSYTRPTIWSNAGVGWLLSLGRITTGGYQTPDGNEHKFFPKLHESDPTVTLPPNVTSVGYTRDKTYLRSKGTTTGTLIESPDSITRFFAPDGELGSITDRFNNSLIVTRLNTPPTACTATPNFAFAWRIADNGRTNYVCFTDAPYPDSTYDGQVERVVLTSPPATPGGTSRTATYTFTYTPMTLDRICCSTWQPGGQTTLPTAMLTTLTLSDGSTYSFTYNTNASYSTNACDATTTVRDMGLVTSMTLPTKATIAYTYRDYRMPADSACDTGSFDSWVTGVAKRTITGPRISSATWTWCTTFNTTPASITCYDGNGNPFTTGAPSEEMTVALTDPAGNITQHFYSVWPGTQQISSPDGFDPKEYGLPITRMPQTAYGSTQLSTRTYTSAGHTAGTPTRTSYVSYTLDDGCGGVLVQCPGNPRVTAARTLYHDDENKTALTSYTDFDGLGHFRRVQTVDLDGTSVKETYTAFNQLESTVNPAGYSYYFLNSGTYPGSFTMPALDQAWVLETSPYTRRSDSTATLLTQTCYDPQTGFLRAARARLNPTFRKTNDLLVTYTATAAGDVETETFAGGDIQNNASTSQTLCQIADSPPTTYDYQLTHSYITGVRATSQYTGVPFPSLNQTIDAGTGFVLGSADPAGRTTTYAYDDKFRLSSITPPGTAATSYAYTNASGTGSTFTPARVEATTPSAQGLGTVTTHYQYDALGRLWRRKRLVADNTWSLQETTYDANGRISAQSVEAALPPTSQVPNELDFHPAATTFSGFDPFGRPTTITSPDGTSITYAYKGERVRDKTATVGATSVTDREEYDRYGHLRGLTQNYTASATLPALTASYTYDPADRLTTVSIPTGAGTQNRIFCYDNRGFLKWEQHPELGANGDGRTVYGTGTPSTACSHTDETGFTPQYDALGHTHRKITGSFDLSLEHDTAERPTITKNSTTNQELIHIAYDGAFNTACTGTSCYGKISAAQRNHYDADLGTVIVTESYQYDTAGRPGRRDRTIGATGETFFFTQEYNDLGTIKKLTYPVKVVGQATDRTPPEITYGYTNGFLTSVTNTADGTTSAITYQPNGLINTVTHGGSTPLYETWLPDPNGMPRPCRIIAYNQTVTITTNASSPCGKQITGTPQWDSGLYAYDASGNITQLGLTSEKHTEYTYDVFGRLAGWNVKDGLGGFSWTGRGYDDYGNWLYDAFWFCGPPSGNVRGPCGGSSILPAQIVGTTNHYVGTTYDDAGNVTNDFNRSFTFDATGALVRTQTDGRDFRLLYSPDNERIGVVEPGVIISSGTNPYTLFLRGFDDHLLSTYTTNPSTGTSSWREDSFFRGAVLLGNNHVSSGMRRYALDHLGSPRAVMNAFGTTSVQDFSPFGRGGTSDGGSLQFTGHERDQASIGNGTAQLPDYFHTRYYDPGRGRFLSVDPVIKPGAMSSPQLWNRYTYTANNPMNRIDPDGRNWFYIDDEWEWHKGRKYTDENGKKYTSNYTHLLVAQAVGKTATGATQFKLTLYNQNKVAGTGSYFSGGGGHPRIPLGNYTIRGDIKDAVGPNMIDPDSPLMNPPVFYGMQVIRPEALLNPANGNYYDVFGAYGPIRAYLNPWDPSVAESRGNYLHGQAATGEAAHGYTHGCLCYGQDTRIINYLWKLGERVPVSIDGAVNPP